MYLRPMAASWVVAGLLSTPILAAQKQDIVDTAVAAGQFKTLAKALDAAGLVDTLKGKGPFTVFAPTDEAFGKLPEGTLGELLKPENKPRLAAILTYHVVPGSVDARKALKAGVAPTVNGQRVSIKSTDKGAMVNAAKIVKTDIECRNGIIHVIDAVILPSDKNIVETAKAAGGFNTLLTAATQAGLAETLAGKGPLTVFAPTDEAFAKLPPGTIESLLKPENKQQLANILKLHVVSGRAYSSDVAGSRKAKSLLGESLGFTESDGALRVNGARIVKADIDTSNGVIHVIDTVLLPK